MTYNELKEKAKELGVEFTGQPSKDDLIKWIAEVEAATDPVEVEAAEAEKARLAEEAAMAAKAAKFEMPNEESKKATKNVLSGASKKLNARKEALLMRKVKITPLDERMRGIPSETYSVGNAQVGFISKVVKFNTPRWEPAWILQLLRERKMVIQESDVVNGKEIVRKIETEAFSIIDVPLKADEKATLAASKK